MIFALRTFFPEFIENPKAICQKRARTRWFLALTLHNNPELQKLRKDALNEVLMKQLNVEGLNIESVENK